MASRALPLSIPCRVRQDRLTCLGDLHVHASNRKTRRAHSLGDVLGAPQRVGLLVGLTAQLAERLSVAGAGWVLGELHAHDDGIDLDHLRRDRHAGRDLASVERQARVVDAHDLADLPHARRVYGFHGAYFLPSNVSASPHRFGSRVPQMLT